MAPDTQENTAEKNGLGFRQLFDGESSTYTYLLFDPETKETVIIDSVFEQVDRDIGIINELGLDLRYILETHVHADHITGATKLKEALGGEIALSQNADVEGADLMLKDGDQLAIGRHMIECLETPGHTNSCMTFYTDGRLFTGDTLFVRGCGRTDFQEGSNEKLFASVREKIFNYPDHTMIYPGHDYKGRTVSSVLEEKNFNPRLKVENSLEDFKCIMNQLKLAYPKKLEVALPANLKCGRV